MKNKISPHGIYYVSRNLCDGIRCHYHGLQIMDYEAIKLNEGLSITVTIGGIDYTIDHDVFNEGDFVGVDNNYSMALQIAKYFKDISEEALPRAIRVTENGIRGIEIIAHDRTSDMDKYVLYFVSDMVVTLAGHDEENETDIRYLGTGARDDIYYLCRNVSYNYGACRDRNENVKYSNISGNEVSPVKVPGEGWSVPNRKPIILGNCRACGECIDICPRRAIKNTINDKPENILSLPGGVDFLDDVKLNSLTKTGDYSRYSKDVYSMEYEPAMPRIGDAWVDTNDPPMVKVYMLVEGVGTWVPAAGANINIEYPGYMYVAYASDTLGTDFSTTYDAMIHTYVGIRTSDEIIETPGPEHFMGLWHRLGYEEPPSWYTYVAYASDNEGADFSITYNPAVHTFVATLSTSEYIEELTADNFVGLWRAIGTGEEVWDGGIW